MEAAPMHDFSLATYTWTRSALVHARHRLETDDRGEGVISAAIVVLIMAFLGVLMWGAFKLLFQNASTNTSEQVDQIGS
jgi:type VI protein secretion system component VasF